MKVVVPLAEGFEEIETSAIVDILRRAEIEVITAGLSGKGQISGAHGIKFASDTGFDEIKADDFDAIVLPGGSPGFVNLGNDEGVLKLVKEMYDKDKYVSAICGAPSVLSKSGILKGVNATIYPGCRDMLTDAKYIEERVVKDKKIITSQGPGTAIEFAIKLVEVFLSAEKAEEIKKDVLAE